MSEDWDNNFDEDLDRAAKSAKDRTDKQLSENTENLIQLSEEDIKSICPSNADKEKLDKLLNVVKGATDDNHKINSIFDSTKEFQQIILNILKKLR